MKKESYILWAYAALLCLGGIMGFAKAGSVISIIVSFLFATILFASGSLMQKNNRLGYWISLSTLAVLLIFFTYRFFLSYAFMPAGLMVLLTTLVLIPFLAKLKTFYKLNHL